MDRNTSHGKHKGAAREQRVRSDYAPDSYDSYKCLFTIMLFLLLVEEVIDKNQEMIIKKTPAIFHTSTNAICRQDSAKDSQSRDLGYIDFPSVIENFAGSALG